MSSAPLPVETVYPSVIQPGGARAQPHQHQNDQFGMNPTTHAGYRSNELSRTNLYIRNLPTEWNTNDLQAHFMRFGNIASAYIMQDPSTGVSRGVGFVRFETHEMAQQAINAMNNVTPDGGSKPLIVKFAASSRNNPRDSVQNQIGGGQRGMGGAHSRGGMRGFNGPLGGPLGVNVNPAALSAAGAVVAPMAVDRRVHGAAPVRYSHTNIYVADLPTTMRKEEVDELFSKYGEISSSTLLVDPSSNEPRGVAMVRFASPECAAAAIEALNGQTLPGSTKPLQVRYAKVGGSKARAQAQAQAQALAQQSYRAAYNPAVAAPVILTGQPTQAQQQQFYSYSGAATTYPPAQYGQPVVTQGYPGMAPASAHGQAFYPQYAPAPQFYAAPGVPTGVPTGVPAGVPTGAPAATPQVVAAQAVVPLPITPTVPAGNVAMPAASSPASAAGQPAASAPRTK